MKIKFLITPEWLLEWFWSLVKLHAFQWPHKLIACQTDSSNTKSGKLQKLGGGQKIFIFFGGGGGLSYEGVVRKFSFSRGLSYWGGGNFLGGGWYPSAHYAFGLISLGSKWLKSSFHRPKSPGSRYFLRFDDFTQFNLWLWTKRGPIC